MNEFQRLKDENRRLKATIDAYAKQVQRLESKLKKEQPDLFLNWQREHGINGMWTLWERNPQKEQ